jgi:hypothetical protein
MFHAPAEISSHLDPWRAGDGRDRVIDVLRGADARLDNFLRGVSGAALSVLPGGGTQAATPEDVEAARALVLEAVDVVEQV